MQFDTDVGKVYVGRFAIEENKEKTKNRQKQHAAVWDQQK